MTRKTLVIAFGAFSVYMMLALSGPVTSNAGVIVNITLPGPVIPAPPPMVVVPGSYVYYPPDVSVDIFFYNGYWYRPYGGGWYIASGYNGPWRVLAPGHVPHALISLPPAYRRLPPGERMPYNMVKGNWRTWQKERHWDKPRGEHGGPGHEREHGNGREEHREEHR